MSIYTNNQNVIPANKPKRTMSKWNYEDTTPVGLCKGVEIDTSVYEISENRYYTLILKGIIVYLITAGGHYCGRTGRIPDRAGYRLQSDCFQSGYFGDRYYMRDALS